MPELDGRRVSLRPVSDEDLPRLREINNEPSVARWWGTDEVMSVDDEVRFTIRVDGEIVGMIEYSEVDDPRYRSAGIDLFLATAHQGKGLGPEAIAVLARHLITDRGHHRLTIDPAVANEAAIRAYEKLGFRPVGVMRRYERDPATGEWGDGLLMDMLADELEA